MDEDRKPLNNLRRFMTFVEMPDDPNGCWAWIGGTIRNGYGHFCVSTKTYKAHRWIYELACGPIAEGMVIRHICDNPNCVNPEHLTIGTHQDNVMDRETRGRGADRKGEKHPLCKVDAETVRRIRQLALSGRTHNRIADEFQISRQHVGKIVRRETWGHI